MKKTMKKTIVFLAAAVIAFFLVSVATAAEEVQLAALNIPETIQVIPEKFSASRALKEVGVGKGMGKNEAVGFYNMGQPLSKKQEKNAKIAVIGLMAIIDLWQSEKMFSRHGYYELNPILEKRPAFGELAAFEIATVAIVYVGGKYLPEPWATIFLDSAATSGRWNIEDNQALMDGGKRRIGIPLILSFRLD